MPRCPFKFKQFLSSSLLHLPPRPPNSSVPRWLTFVSSSSYFDLYFLTFPSLILSSLFFHLLSICIFFLLCPIWPLLIFFFFINLLLWAFASFFDQWRVLRCETWRVEIWPLSTSTMPRSDRKCPNMIVEVKIW